MKKNLLISSMLAVASFGVLAQDSFTSSLGAGINKSDDVDQYGLSASYFFTPVDTTKGPLAEAVFLNRSNSITAGFNRSEFDFAGSEFSANSWSLGGTLHVEGSDLFINAATTQLNGFDSAGYSLGLGYYLSDDWSVSASTGFDEDLEYSNLSLSTKKLITLGGDTFLNLVASIDIPDQGDTSYSLGGDYYFNRYLSVGLQRSWADSFGDGVTAINANWFVNNTMSIGVSYAKTDVDGFTDDSFSLGASARF